MSEKVRINKYLSMMGVLSRRKADEAIDEGRVTVNGHRAVMGELVSEEDEVLLDGLSVKSREAIQTVVIAYNKPPGLVCTSYESDKKSIFRRLRVDGIPMLYYIGRLDKDSQGLLLLTNDGDLCNKIQKARYGHEKEYVVRVDKPIDDATLTDMSGGVPLERMTKPCTVKRLGTHSFKIILTEGMNRQIRRMCEYFGYRVTYLKRVRVMSVKLGDLEPGEYRILEDAEVARLRRAVDRDDA